VQYLEVLPRVRRKPGSVRKRAVLWTEAASTPPAVAAVLWTQEIGFRYVAAFVPDWVLEQLLPMRDKQIGVLETLVLILGLKSFEDQLQGKRVMIYTDNDGVLGAVICESSAAPESNLMLAKVALDAARLGQALRYFRVESRVNV